MKTRKFLAVLLSLAMTLSLLPVSAFADNEEAQSESAFRNSLTVNVKIDGTLSGTAGATYYAIASTNVEALNTALTSGAEATKTFIANGGSSLEAITKVTAANADDTILAVTFDEDSITPTAYGTLDLSEDAENLAYMTVTPTATGVSDYEQANLTVEDSAGNYTYYYKTYDELPDMSEVENYYEINEDDLTKFTSSDNIPMTKDNQYIVVFGYGGRRDDLQSFGATKMEADTVHYNNTLKSVTYTDPLAGDLTIEGSSATYSAFTGIKTLNATSVTITVDAPGANTTLATAWGAANETPTEYTNAELNEEGAATIAVGYDEGEDNFADGDVLYAKVTRYGHSEVYTIAPTVAEKDTAISAISAKVEDYTAATLPEVTGTISTDPLNPTKLTESALEVLAKDTNAQDVTVTLRVSEGATVKYATDKPTVALDEETNTNKVVGYGEDATVSGTTATIPLTNFAKDTLYLKVTTATATTYYALPMKVIANSLTGSLISILNFGGNELELVELDKASADKTQPTTASITLNDDLDNEGKLSAMTVTVNGNSDYTFTVAAAESTAAATSSDYKANGAALDFGTVGSLKKLCVKATNDDGLSYYYQFPLTWTLGHNASIAKVQLDGEAEITSGIKEVNVKTPTGITYGGEINAALTSNDPVTVKITAAREEVDDIAAKMVTLDASNTTSLENIAADFDSLATVQDSITVAELTGARDDQEKNVFTFAGANFSGANSVLLVKVTAENDSYSAVYAIKASNSSVSLGDTGVTEYLFEAGTNLSALTTPATIPVKLTGLSFKDTLYGTNGTTDDTAYFDLENYDSIGTDVTYSVNVTSATDATITLTAGTVKAMETIGTVATADAVNGGNLTLKIKSSALKDVQGDVSATGPKFSVVKAFLTAGEYEADDVGTSAGVVRGSDIVPNPALVLYLMDNYTDSGIGFATTDPQNGLTVTAPTELAATVTVSGVANATGAVANGVGKTLTLAGTVKGDAPESSNVSVTVGETALATGLKIISESGSLTTNTVALTTGNLRVTPSKVVLVKGADNEVAMTLTAPTNSVFANTNITYAPAEATEGVTASWQKSGDVTLGNTNTTATYKVSIPAAGVAAVLAGDHHEENNGVNNTLTLAAGTLGSAAITVNGPEFVEGVVTLGAANYVVFNNDTATFDLTVTANGELPFKTALENSYFTVNYGSSDPTGFTLAVTNVDRHPTENKVTLTVAYTGSGSAAAAAAENLTVAIAKDAFDVDLDYNTVDIVAAPESADAEDAVTLTIASIALKAGQSLTAAEGATAPLASPVVVELTNLKFSNTADIGTFTFSKLDNIDNEKNIFADTDLTVDSVTLDTTDTNNKTANVTLKAAGGVDYNGEAGADQPITGITATLANEPLTSLFDAGTATLRVGSSSLALLGTFDLTIKPTATTNTTVATYSGLNDANEVSATAPAADLTLTITNARNKDTGAVLSDGDYMVKLAIAAQDGVNDDNKPTYAAAEEVVLAGTTLNAGGAANVQIKNVPGVAMILNKVNYYTGTNETLKNKPLAYQLTVRIYDNDPETKLVAESAPTVLTVVPGIATQMTFKIDGVLDTSGTITSGINNDKQTLKDIIVTLKDANGNLVIADENATVTLTKDTQDANKDKFDLYQINEPVTESGIVAYRNDDGEYLFSGFKVVNKDANEVDGKLSFAAADPANTDENLITDNLKSTLTYTFAKDQSGATVHLWSAASEGEAKTTFDAGEELYAKITGATNYNGDKLTGDGWTLVILSNVADDETNDTADKANTLYGYVDGSKYVVDAQPVTFDADGNAFVELAADIYRAKTVTFGPDPSDATKKVATVTDYNAGVARRQLEYKLIKLTDNGSTIEQTAKTITINDASSESDVTPTVNPGLATQLVWTEATGAGTKTEAVISNPLTDTTSATNLDQAAKFYVLDEYDNLSTEGVYVVATKNDTGDDWEIPAGSVVQNTNGEVTFSDLTVRNKTYAEVKGTIQFKLWKNAAGTEPLTNNRVVTEYSKELTLGATSTDASSMILVQPYQAQNKGEIIKAGEELTLDVVMVRDAYYNFVGPNKTFDVTVDVYTAYTDETTNTPAAQGVAGQVVIGETAGTGVLKIANTSTFPTTPGTYLIRWKDAGLVGAGRGSYRVHNSVSTYVSANYVTVTVEQNKTKLTAPEGYEANTADHSNTTASGAKLANIVMTLADKAGNKVNDGSLYVKATIFAPTDGTVYFSKDSTTLVQNHASDDNTDNNIGTATFNNLMVVNATNASVGYTIKFTLCDSTGAELSTEVKETVAQSEATISGLTVGASKSRGEVELSIEKGTYEKAGAITATIGKYTSVGARNASGGFVKGEHNVTFVLTPKDDPEGEVKQYTVTGNFALDETSTKYVGTATIDEDTDLVGETTNDFAALAANSKYIVTVKMDEIPYITYVATQEDDSKRVYSVEGESDAEIKTLSVEGIEDPFYVAEDEPTDEIEVPEVIPAEVPEVIPGEVPATSGKITFTTSRRATAKYAKVIRGEEPNDGTAWTEFASTDFTVGSDATTWTIKDADYYSDYLIRVTAQDGTKKDYALRLTVQYEFKVGAAPMHDNATTGAIEDEDLADANSYKVDYDEESEVYTVKATNVQRHMNGNEAYGFWTGFYIVAESYDATEDDLVINNDVKSIKMRSKEVNGDWTEWANKSVESDVNGQGDIGYTIYKNVKAAEKYYQFKFYDSIDPDSSSAKLLNQEPWEIHVKWNVTFKPTETTITSATFDKTTFDTTSDNTLMLTLNGVEVKNPHEETLDATVTVKNGGNIIATFEDVNLLNENALELNFTKADIENIMTLSVGKYQFTVEVEAEGLGTDNKATLNAALEIKTTKASLTIASVAFDGSFDKSQTENAALKLTGVKMEHADLDHEDKFTVVVTEKGQFVYSETVTLTSTEPEDITIDVQGAKLRTLGTGDHKFDISVIYTTTKVEAWFGSATLNITESDIEITKISLSGNGIDFTAKVEETNSLYAKPITLIVNEDDEEYDGVITVDTDENTATVKFASDVVIDDSQMTGSLDGTDVTDNAISFNYDDAMPYYIESVKLDKQDGVYTATITDNEDDMPSDINTQLVVDQTTGKITVGQQPKTLDVLFNEEDEGKTQLTLSDDLKTNGELTYNVSEDSITFTYTMYDAPEAPEIVFNHDGTVSITAATGATIEYAVGNDTEFKTYEDGTKIDITLSEAGSSSVRARATLHGKTSAPIEFTRPKFDESTVYDPATGKLPVKVSGDVADGLYFVYQFQSKYGTEVATLYSSTKLTFTENNMTFPKNAYLVEVYVLDKELENLSDPLELDAHLISSYTYSQTATN